MLISVQSERRRARSANARHQSSSRTFIATRVGLPTEPLARPVFASLNRQQDCELVSDVISLEPVRPSAQFVTVVAHISAGLDLKRRLQIDSLRP